MTASGNAAEGSPRGNIRGRRDPLAVRQPDRDAALHRARHMAPQASSTRDQHAAGRLVVRGVDFGESWTSGPEASISLQKACLLELLTDPM